VISINLFNYHLNLAVPFGSDRILYCFTLSDRASGSLTIPVMRGLYDSLLVFCIPLSSLDDYENETTNHGILQRRIAQLRYQIIEIGIYYCQVWDY
jgi:hypothetical protein